MLRTFLLALLLTASTNTLADIRNKVQPVSGSGLTNIIVPGNTIFDIPLGTHEDVFIKRYGQPTGYVRFSETESGMIYGKSFCFLFSMGELSGVRISHGILDWKLSNRILAFSVFDRMDWKLSNGIKKQMNLTRIKKILGDSLKVGEHGYHRYYEVGNTRIELDLSHRVDSEGDDDAYILYGIMITEQ